MLHRTVRKIVGGAVSIGLSVLGTYGPLTALPQAGAVGGAINRFATSAPIRIQASNHLYPYEMVSTGSHLWVANRDSNTVSEINETTGSVMRVFGSTTFQISHPVALAFDGLNIWVANQVSTVGLVGSNSVTEINESSGQFETNRVWTSGWEPTALLCEHGHLWIGLVSQYFNPSGPALLEINEKSFALMHSIADPRFSGSFKSLAADAGSLWAGSWGSIGQVNLATGVITRVLNNTQKLHLSFDGALELASDGSHLWVANYPKFFPPTENVSLSEIDESSGSLVKYVPGGSQSDSSPAVAIFGGKVWVAGLAGTPITEFDTTTGAVVRRLSGRTLGFSQPCSLVIDGHGLWVGNLSGGSIAQIDVGTGALVRVIS